MSNTVKIPVNPEIFLYARKSAGFSIEEIITKLKRNTVNEALINTWENLGGEISLTILKDLASIYKRPLTFFFLKELPPEKIIPQDFRTLPNNDRNIHGKIKLSPKAMLFIRRAKHAQQRIHDLGLELGKNFRKKLFHVHLSDNPISLANKIREKLKIKIEEQSKWKDAGLALKNWIRIIENNGIIIQQDSIDIEEGFRGFSLTGNTNLLPLIFLSTKDSANGRIFTLLHEYCHLMLNESGIKIENNAVFFDNNIKNIEVFCNEFAAAFLVPKDILLNHEIVINKDENDFSEENLDKLSKYFAVSKEVITLRLKKFNRVNQKFYENKKNEWAKIEKKETKGRKFWDLYYLNNNGALYVSVVYELYHKKTISTSDLLSELNFKSNYIEKVENRLNQHFLSSANGE